MDVICGTSLDAAAAEVHGGLEAGAEGDLHREGARPDDQAGPVDHVHMTRALRGREGVGQFLPKKGRLREFGTDKGEGGGQKSLKFRRRHM